MTDVKPGSLYAAKTGFGEIQQFIVTGVGINHVLVADHPLIKMNDSYLEYCVARKEFSEKFTFVGGVESD